MVSHCKKHLLEERKPFYMNRLRNIVGSKFNPKWVLLTIYKQTRIRFIVKRSAELFRKFISQTVISKLFREKVVNIVLKVGLRPFGKTSKVVSRHKQTRRFCIISFRSRPAYVYNLIISSSFSLACGILKIYKRRVRVSRQNGEIQGQKASFTFRK